jgi:hypothetical protein
VLFITYSFAYLDRVNYSFAAAGGIWRRPRASRRAPRRSSARCSSWVFHRPVPGAIYAERQQRQDASSFLCLSRGAVLSALTGVVSNIRRSCSCGFLLGVVEAACFPR